MSEMHREDFLVKTIKPEADAVIFAGDIVEGHEIDILKEQLGAISKPIYYVAGNHEYWGVPCIELTSFLKHELRHFHNVKILENESVVFDDTVIIGGTLWTNLHNPVEANMIRGYMRDFIRSPGLTTDWTNAKHDETVKYIKNCLDLEQWRGKKKIVVTHHGPSFQAVAEYYRFDAANCGYQSNLNYLLYFDHAPEIWIHGHSHVFMDEFIGKTRVIRNPLGYKSYGEMTTGFNESFMIDTDRIDEVTKPKKKVTDMWDDDFVN
jgi:predicted phosphodiesterase